jgi:hypothetical protein
MMAKWFQRHPDESPARMGIVLDKGSFGLKKCLRLRMAGALALVFGAMTSRLKLKLRESFITSTFKSPRRPVNPRSIVIMASSFVRSAFSGKVLHAGKKAAFAPTIFIRGKATLPDLACEFGNYSDEIFARAVWN